VVAALEGATGDVLAQLDPAPYQAAPPVASLFASAVRKTIGVSASSGSVWTEGV
jgi:multidrug resistance efflux pump